MNKRTWLAGCCIALASWLGFSPCHLSFVGGRAEGLLPGRLSCQLRAAPKGWQTPPKEITSRISDSASASMVLEVLESEHTNPALNMISICAAWVTIAKLQRTVSPEVAADPYWKDFIKITLDLLKEKLLQDPSNTGRDCANIFWAAGSLRAQRILWPYLDELTEALTEGVAFTSYFMNAQQVANAIWACGKLALSRPTLKRTMTPLVCRLPDVVEECQSQQIGSILWAAGKLGREAPQLLEQMPLLAEVMPEKIDDFGPQEVASSLLSISLLPADVSTGLLGEVPQLAQRAGHVLHKMSGQQVANTCWGLAVIGNIDPQLIIQARVGSESVRHRNYNIC